ncbi:MAG: hypothetical protein ABL949_07655 [Fimbriimonadaceae bacterium]
MSRKVNSWWPKVNLKSEVDVHSLEDQYKYADSDIEIMRANTYFDPNKLHKPGFKIIGTITIPPLFSIQAGSKWGYAQHIKVSRNFTPGPSFNYEWRLDNLYPYGGYHEGINQAFLPSLWFPCTSELNAASDSPSHAIGGYSHPPKTYADIDDAFRMFAVFSPPTWGSQSKHEVPASRHDWKWNSISTRDTSLLWQRIVNYAYVSSKETWKTLPYGEGTKKGPEFKAPRSKEMDWDAVFLNSYFIWN